MGDSYGLTGMVRLPALLERAHLVPEDRTTQSASYPPALFRCNKRASISATSSAAKRIVEMEIKKRHGSPCLFWQREKDSNPHIRSQSPLCYLYTIPLCPDEQRLLYRFHGVCQQFFQKIRNLSAPQNLAGSTWGWWCMKGARCVGARKERSSDKRGLPEAVLWGGPQVGMMSRNSCAAHCVYYICIEAAFLRLL